MDGEWINIIIKEEFQLEKEKNTRSRGGSVFTSDESDEDGATAEGSREAEEEGNGVNDVIFSRKLERQTGDFAGLDNSQGFRKAELKPRIGELLAVERKGKEEFVTRIEGSFSLMISKDGSDSISNSPQTVVDCSIGSASDKDKSRNL